MIENKTTDTTQQPEKETNVGRKVRPREFLTDQEVIKGNSEKQKAEK